MRAIPLSTLDSLQRWVAWRNEMHRGKLRKVPYDPATGSRAASDNPTTWGSKGDAQAMASRILNGAGGGIGIMLGDLGNGRGAIGGIDLDTCRDENGNFLSWALEVMQSFSSYCEISPSRTGAKIFFVYDPADLNLLRSQTKTDWSKAWKVHGYPEHPPAIELHLGNRYFTVTGEKLKTCLGELRPVPVATLQWLIAEAGPGIVGKAPRKTVTKAAGKAPDQEANPLELHDRIEQAAALQPHLAKRWRGDWNGLNDASQSGMAMALGTALVRAGFSFPEMCSALAQHSDTAEWAKSKGVDCDFRELRRIFEKAEASGERLPDLIVQGANLPATAKELCQILAQSGFVFDRGGVPVLLRHPAEGGPPRASRLTANAVITLAHSHCRPVKMTDERQRKGVTLPERVANMYLDLPEWGLRPLAGVSCAPLLQEDGNICAGDGYDPALQVWCCKVPPLAVPANPTRAQAEAALRLLRQTFRTFPFQDALFLQENGLAVVDTSQTAGLAESSFLAALLTAVCRPSLWLAPGLLVTAPEVTGSGAGKGLLVRAICAIAYGEKPAPFTAGHDRHELDKRLVAELIEANPITFLDNVNGAVLRSDTLASVLTERPARVRVMGLSQMVPLNCAGLIALTGNGLSVSEDLARRFLSIPLEPQCEDAEARPFPGNLVAELLARRSELLSAVLTIWRWGRQNADGIKPGLPFASYEVWARWCRDPLIALGCADPVKRVRDAKQADPKRRMMADLFARWREKHGGAAVTVADLASEVLDILDPQQRGRQYRAARLLAMAGMRIAGYRLDRQSAAGKWGAATYAVVAVEPEKPAASAPNPPTPPMPQPANALSDWQGEV